MILDSSARDEVFGDNQTRAGEQFFDWLEAPNARLVLGGRLTDELTTSNAFEKWAETAIKDGRVRTFSRHEVDAEAESLAVDWQGQSNDQHVVALARVSRARVLYTRDIRLSRDFRDRALVPAPRGRVYPTGDSRNAQKSRTRLLNETSLCPNR